MFVIISVIYRPIEQLLSRTIAERRARGHAAAPAARADAIQAGFALLFSTVALALHEQLIDNVFDGYTALYWCWSSARSPTPPATSPAAGSPATSASALFGGLVLMESASRFCFALAVAVGMASGETAVALGIAAAPLLSLVVVPAAFARRARERRGRRRRTALAQTPRRRRTRSPRRGRRGLGGPGHRGRAGGATHEELSLAPRRPLRALGLGDHARRADAAQRRGADRRRDLPQTRRWPGSSSTCC